MPNEEPLEILYCLPGLHGFDGYTVLAADLFQDLHARGHHVDCAVLLEDGEPYPANARLKDARHIAFYEHPLGQGGLPRFRYRVGNRLTPRALGGRHVCPPGYFRMLQREFPLDRYDFVVTAGARFARVADLTPAPVVCDLHELFSHKAEILATHGIPLASPFESYEEEFALLSRFDYLWCPSREIYDILANRFPESSLLERHLSLPAVVDDDTKLGHPPADAPPRILFVGSTAAENQPGVRVFLRDVWPSVRRAVPDAEFHIVGWTESDLPAGTDPRGIVAHGRLATRAEVLDCYEQCHVLVIPRFLGGLTIKGIEALALGRAVVGHRMAFSGCYPIENGRHALIAENNADLASGVIHLLRHEEERRALADRARTFAREFFTPDRVYGELLRVAPRRIPADLCQA